MNEIWNVKLTGPDGQEIEIQLEEFSLNMIRPVIHNEEKNTLEPSPYRFCSIIGVNRSSTED